MLLILSGDTTTATTTTATTTTAATITTITTTTATAITTYYDEVKLLKNLLLPTTTSYYYYYYYDRVPFHRSHPVVPTDVCDCDAITPVHAVSSFAAGPTGPAKSVINLKLIVWATFRCKVEESRRLQ